ncbi:FAD-binding protein [Microbulbifer sp. SH-1]|uniref:NAD(P)/FAD-dependent oxidoreductase n=1 Tax=Microbulbifer sp. SH-1 TaxID=2681547 RepID=UPI00140C09C1|nr:NAD(P)/FAD-dependent oxidoreductase [Microbulbifer sp. SH-1]QIL90602.1 FAD-binding protein [Microbulbifer sp. SH-1]
MSPFDVAVIGGSYAGMTAALQLARGRRKVLVVDAGQRRNRFAAHAYGILGQDGRPPAEIAADGRAQLLRYPNVTCVEATVESIEKTADDFQLQTQQGEVYHASRVILATGVSDELPNIPGLRERWGRAVFHCPYCHGYELDEAPLGVLAVGEISMHQALILPDWGPTTFFINGAFEPSADQLRQLVQRNVTVERTPVEKITGGRAAVNLQDGRIIELSGLFVATQLRHPRPLADQLGCAFEETPMGAVIQTDAMQATSIAGVFACGDSARAAGNVTFAMADGAMAGVAAHRSLMFEGLNI